MIPIIPLYDLSYSSPVLAIAKKFPIAVIVNVDSGPAKELDPEWKNLIAALAKSKAKIFGYIPTRHRTQADIDRDVLGWAGYGVKKTFFFDEYEESTLNLPNASTSIANPGTATTSVCGVTVVWETNGYLKSKPFSPAKSVAAVMALGEADFRKSVALAKARKVGYFWCTDLRDGPKVYDRLPKYFDALVAAIQ